MSVNVSLVTHPRLQQQFSASNLCTNVLAPATSTCTRLYCLLLLSYGNQYVTNCVHLDLTIESNLSLCTSHPLVGFVILISLCDIEVTGVLLSLEFLNGIYV